MVRDLRGEDFASKAENDSSSPNASRAVSRPNLYVDIYGVSRPNRAVPFISKMVLPCLFKFCIGQTTLLLCVAAPRWVCILAGLACGHWCLAKDSTQLRLLGLCKRN